MKAYAQEDWHDNETNTDHQAGAYFGVPTAATATRGTSEWTMSPEQKWLNGVPTSYWSWNEVEPVITPANGYDKASFSYTVSGTVTSQKDLVFAYNGENVAFNDAGAITEHTSTNKEYRRTDDQLDIHFYHALSAIKFDISGVEEASVDKITLSGIYPGGDCAVTVSDDGVPEFDWTATGTTTSYSQAFDETDFDTDGKLLAGRDKEFMLIPQALTEASTLSVTFSGGDSPAKSIKGVTWKPGKYYTYKLSKLAVDYDYTFTLEWSDYTFNDNKDYDSSVINAIKSYRVRSDKPDVKERVNWKIKSYALENGEDVEVGKVSLYNMPDAVWLSYVVSTQSASVSPTGESDKLTLRAKKADKIEKGSHDYWVNSDGRTDDLEWSPADWSDKGVINLSRMDVYTDVADAHSMTTSNCYIVRHAGTYMLPLVYGNGVKNGTENVPSYYTGNVSGGTNRLARFVNHLDNGITSAFIENNGCVAKEAVLLGETNAKVLSDVKIVGTRPATSTAGNVRYLQFTIDQDKVQQNNALVAIKDNDGNVIWSWHIWITNDPDVVGDPIEVTNWYGNKYQFLSVDNIGTISETNYLPRPYIKITLQQDAPSNKTLTMFVAQKVFESQTTSLMYEWGRKDPFFKKTNDASGNSFQYEQVPGNTIGAGIRNPMIWYGFKANSYQWTMPLYSNLWTGKKATYVSTDGSAGEKDGNTIKTIYDPSPVGYMVPPIGAFSGFDTRVGNHPSDSESQYWNVLSTVQDNGYVFYTSLGPNHTVNTSGPTISFHIDGVRAGNGASYLDYYSAYHTSVLYNEDKITSSYTTLGNCCIFDLEKGRISSFSVFNPSNGCSIRPVKE